MSTFKELLGTDNKKEQEEKVEALLKIASTPEISLLVRYDGINDQITLNVFGGNVPFDTIHRILELASQAIRREEVNTAVAQSQPVPEEEEVEE